MCSVSARVAWQREGENAKKLAGLGIGDAMEGYFFDTSDVTHHTKNYEARWQSANKTPIKKPRNTRQSEEKLIPTPVPVLTVT
jgi:hypothetical protein